MAKPTGPICNLDCHYCYYLEKEELYPARRRRDWAMSDEVLESFVRQRIASTPGPEVEFTWQGGEPTLLGTGFFRRAVELQRRYAGRRRVTNVIQTNGVLLDDEWGGFLAEHDFLVGLSVDGPRDLHDGYRVDRGGSPTFDRVMDGLDVLKRHGVEFNTLTCVHALNQDDPLRVYRFLKEIGSRFMQFIPVVERAGPGPSGGATGVTERSVDARAFGEFLVAVFDEWVRNDVGRWFVQAFDVALEAWCGLEPSLCVFRPECGDALALEHNGDLYSCDHFVEPEHRLGNITELPLPVLAGSAQQDRFGAAKRTTLPTYCLECDVRFACNGGCPKNRLEIGRAHV